jgi:heptosyltransferase II
VKIVEPYLPHRLTGSITTSAKLTKIAKSSLATGSAPVSVDPALIRRLVIRAPNWLGDAVMALPALGALRQAFRESHLTVAADASIGPFFQENTNAAQDAVLAIPDPRQEASLLANGAFDAALLLTNSFRTALAARRAGIRERWGYAAGFRRVLLTRAVARPRAHGHQSAYYLELARGLGIDASEARPHVTVRVETKARAAAVLHEHRLPPETVIVGFAPGAAYGHAKRWPPDRVGALITRLSRERGVRALIFGAAGDRAAGREIESSLPPGVGMVNLIGRTDLRLLAGLVDRCAAFVSNDSGAMHLAGALGVPLVAIFGPTDERATAPLGAVSEPDVLTHPVFCRPCMLRDCPIDHRCMKGITVDRVFERVAARIEGAR